VSDLPSSLQQAGIAERDVLAGQVRLREMTGMALVRLRFYEPPVAMDSPPPGLPAQTGQCEGTDPALLCLGPKEWLAISATANPDHLLQRLQKVVDPTGGSAVGTTSGLEHGVAHDLSDGLALLRLTGTAAPWLLSKLSGLDFLAGVTEGQHCARTRLGDAAVTLHYHQADGEEWAFDVIVDRSVAAYLWALLQACAPHANELNQTFGVAR